MSSTELPGPIEVAEALERLRALDPDSAAVVELWARQTEAEPALPISFERTVRVHVGNR